MNVYNFASVHEACAAGMGKRGRCQTPEEYGHKNQKWHQPALHAAAPSMSRFCRQCSHVRSVRSSEARRPENLGKMPRNCWRDSAPRSLLADDTIQQRPAMTANSTNGR